MSFGVALGMVLAAAAGGQVREPAACAALHQQFEQNERSMAALHQLNQRLLDADREAYEKLSTPEFRRDLDRSEYTLARDDKAALEKGDRITTLLIANHCTPPDHVTSWATYSNEVASR